MKTFERIRPQLKLSPGGTLRRPKPAPAAESPRAAQDPETTEL
jgi:hypothetical protein